MTKEPTSELPEVSIPGPKIMRGDMFVAPWAGTSGCFVAVSDSDAENGVVVRLARITDDGWEAYGDPLLLAANRVSQSIVFSRTGTDLLRVRQRPSEGPIETRSGAAVRLAVAITSLAIAAIALAAFVKVLLTGPVQ